MGSGFLFDIINQLFAGAGAGVSTIFAGPLGGILIFILSFAIIGLVWFYARKVMSGHTK